MAATFLGRVEPPAVVAVCLLWLPRITAVMTAASTSTTTTVATTMRFAPWLGPLPPPLPPWPLRREPLGAAAWILALRLALLLVMRGPLGGGSGSGWSMSSDYSGN